MSNINLGSQDILWKFRYPVKGIHNHRAYRDLILPGIFSGLNLSVLSTTQIEISSGVVVIQGEFNGVDDIVTRIKFGLNFPLTVSQNVPGEDEIIYMLYEYQEVIQNFADVLHDNVTSFLASPPDNAVILGQVQFNGSGDIISISLANRMERAVAHMNEFGLFTNPQGNKFLYTTGFVDRDFETPADGHIAVIKELTIDVGVTFTISPGKEVIIIDGVGSFSGFLSGIVLTPTEEKTFLFAGANVVISSFSGDYDPLIKLWNVGNVIHVKNYLGINVIVDIQYIASNT